jgi:hypothetical protein
MPVSGTTGLILNPTGDSWKEKTPNHPCCWIRNSPLGSRFSVGTRAQARREPSPPPGWFAICRFAAALTCAHLVSPGAGVLSRSGSEIHL